MHFGHFDDQQREYVISDARTPLPWINYLGSEDFFALLSNTAGGYCFYRDARLRRLTRYRYNNCPTDQVPFLYQRRQRSLEPRLAAHKNGAGRLYLPPRPWLQRD